MVSAYVPLRHYHRKLGAGFVTLPQMTGRHFGMPFILSPPTLALRFRQNNGPTPSADYQPSRSLFMAGSDGQLWGYGCLLMQDLIVIDSAKCRIEKNTHKAYTLTPGWLLPRHLG